MYKRNLLASICTALQDTPVLILGGARQVGKSTFLRTILPPELNIHYETLDDLTTLAAAKSDPDAFLAKLQTHTIAIDEIQLAPELIRTIKKKVDENRKPGKYILSGSANVMMLPKLTESLAGRAEIFHMQPLSQQEIIGVNYSFIDDIFSADPNFSDPTLNWEQLANIMFYGGYPEVYGREISRKDAWYKSYITALLQRDVRDISAIEGISDMPRLLEHLAARAGNLLNIADISRSSAIKNTTLNRYITLLEAIFIIYKHQPWHFSIDKKLTKTNKIYLNDSGLLCYLLGIGKEELLNKTSNYTGSVLENWVLNEIQKQISWSALKPDLYFFRTTAGSEVDIVLTTKNKQKVGIEIKASAKVDLTDFKGLKELQALTQDDFLRGIVFYTGTQTVQFAEKLFAVPLSIMWNATGATRHHLTKSALV